MQFSPEIQLLLKKSVSTSVSTDDYERSVNEEETSGEWQRKVDERVKLLQRATSNDSLGSSLGGAVRRGVMSREVSNTSLNASLRSSPEPKTSEVNSSAHSSCESAIPVKTDIPQLLLPKSPRPDEGLASGGILESVVSGRGLSSTTRVDTTRDTSRDTTIYMSPRIESILEQDGEETLGEVEQGKTGEVVYDLDGITWETMSKSIKYGKQLGSILSTCRNNICRMGWRCWETEINCGGAFTEEPNGNCVFLHREPIVKTEESVAQFVLALSFLRRCIASKIAVSSDLFLRAIDNYVASGLEKHPCSVTMVRNVKDEIDIAAERYAKGLPLDPHVEEKPQPHTERVQRGIIIAAALSLGCAKIDELLREDYVSMVSGAAIPVYIEPPKAEYSASFVAPRRGSIAGQPVPLSLSPHSQPSSLSPRRASAIGLPPLSPSSLAVVASPRRVSNAGSTVPAAAASVVASSGKGGILKKIGGLFSPRTGSPRKESPRKPD